MPSLVMRAPPGSLLEQTCQLVVRPPDRSTARERGVPWGISESAFNVARPRAHLPVLELRRARARARSAASARTSSSRPTRPRSPRWSTRRGGARTSRAWRRSARAAATASTRRSTTPRAACPRAATVALVRAYMAHHQGMTLVALANVLHDGAMRTALPRRADRAGRPSCCCRSATPRDVGGRAAARRGGHAGAARARPRAARSLRRFASPHEPDPAHATCSRTAATRSC